LNTVAKYGNGLLASLAVLSFFAAVAAGTAIVYCAALYAVRPVARDFSGEPGYAARDFSAPAPTAAAEKAPAPAREETALPPPIVLSFVGDCTLGQNYDASGDRSFSAVYEKNSPEYFLSGVRSVFASDDLTIVNCEGPLTDAVIMRDKPEDGPKYWFRGPPEYAEIFSGGGVEIANLANNHTRDYGDEGYQDTKDALLKNGVAYFGNADVLVRQARGVRIGFFGLSAYAGAGLIKARIDELRSAGAHLIIASFHGGSSSVSYVPSDSQKNAARAAIENGATFVVGHHPHVLQGIEEYKGGVIAYSLGNFCFGGHSNPADKDTMIFQIIIRRTEGEKLLCSYRIIPASISSREDYNDYRPRVLEGEEADRALEKILALSETLSETRQP
jgi:poly-gamma-glutamate synthesis protein (capsule biosynthesis protein)